jgi:hypothetical protein
MRRNTWRVRTSGDRWVVPGRDDYPLELRVSYALYLILIQLPETNSILNAGEFNTFVMGDYNL